MGDYYGLETSCISNGVISLEYLLSAGPRIVRLFHKECPDNILVEVPEKTHQTDYGTYYFRGGHRLWHAPEHTQRTYIPDNLPVSIASSADGITLTQPVESGTGIQKSIEIILDRNLPKITLHHLLINRGLWPINLSAWAITPLPLGGTALFPQNTSPVDSDGLLPNRNLALWSYTSLADPRLSLADDLITIIAQAALPPLKIGYANSAGWTAYYRNTILFVKSFFPQAAQPHPDFGCNVETYCGNQFIELETLSPLTSLAPGQSLQHTEVWDIIAGVSPSSDLSDLCRLITRNLHPDVFTLAARQE